MSDTRSTVSSSVNVKTNGGESWPPGSRIFIPNAAITVMTMICVGNPEQRITSTMAAARSTGCTARGVSAGGAA
jgi:hypothetical protein